MAVKKRFIDLCEVYMRVLGIETSCDETGLAIYDTELGLLAHSTYSQTEVHLPFGGVVPELASRDHVRKIIPLLDEVLAKATLSRQDIDGIAYTKGPGLVGALLVGAMFARTLAFVMDVPAVGVHHLEGHLLAPFLEPLPPRFPFLALLISGGHTEFVIVKALGDYEIIGDTLDDAVGEAFDKTAKLLGIPYPGGAKLAALADRGNSKRFRFPRPMVDRPGLDFSFSGLKTFAANTVRQILEMNEMNDKSDMNDEIKADIARAFQDAVVDTITIKCRRALSATAVKRLVIAGGVSANLALRKSLQTLCNDRHVELFFPRLEFCTDNGAMIAYAGAQRLLAGEREDFSVDVYARWPIDAINSL